MPMKWEYAFVEWIWNQDTIRCDMPGGQTFTAEGSYAQVVELLTRLGGEGWEVVGCSGSANWLLWTLKRGRP